MAHVREILEKLWLDYVGTNTGVEEIHSALVARGEHVVNDHIALRTFDHPRVHMLTLGATFERHGYVRKKFYVFPEKKLHAIHLEHPDPTLPLVFISQLCLSQCTNGFSKMIEGLVHQVDPMSAHESPFLHGGRPWSAPTYSDYMKLKDESEYGAWVAMYGIRANHFTVSVNDLSFTQDIRVLNKYIRSLGYELNSAGGEVKGSPAVFLEQSSTLALPRSMDFSDGPRDIPGCFYEFAKRHYQPDGTLFRGFVQKSANLIFESTDDDGDEESP